MTHRLGETMSVRLPRFSRWEGQVRREQRWLPRLAPQLPLPVPVPLAVGAPTAEYPFPWSVYRWLDGERDNPERLTDLRCTALDLAEFFLALQGIDVTDGPPPEWSNGFRGVAMGDPRDSAVVEARVRTWIALAVDDATWARGRAWGLTAALPDPSRPATDGEADRFDTLVADLRCDRNPRW